MYNTYMLKNKFLSFIIFLLVTYSASFVGGIVTLSFKEPWYSQLIKSNFNPPDWIFAPVWTLLYLFMTIAIWNAWHKNTKNINLVYIYFIHLFFNTTWSIIFFGLQSVSLAMLNLIVLILFIVLLMFNYRRVSIISFYLMIPYLFWCCFALILNISIFIKN